MHMHVSVHLSEPAHIEVADHDGIPAYYRLKFASEITLFISDEQRRQILDVLSSAPPLPKSDEQIDEERGNPAMAPTMGDVEVLRG